jgi:hypothetical protein
LKIKLAVTQARSGKQTTITTQTLTFKATPARKHRR